MKFTFYLALFTLVYQCHSFPLAPRAPPDRVPQVDNFEIEVQTDLSWPLENEPRQRRVNTPEPVLAELNVQQLLDLVEQRLAADLEARPTPEVSEQVIDLYVPTKEVPAKKIPSNPTSDVMFNLESLKTEEILDIIAAFGEENKPREKVFVFEPPKKIPTKEPRNFFSEKIVVLPSTVPTTSNKLTNDLTNILTNELTKDLIYDVTNELTNNLETLDDNSKTDTSIEVTTRNTEPKLSEEELQKFRDYVTIRRSPYTSLLTDFFSTKELDKFKKLYKSSPKLVQETEHVDGPSAKDFSQYESYVDIFIKQPDEVLVKTFSPEQLKRLGDIATRYPEYTDVLTEKGLAEIS